MLFDKPRYPLGDHAGIPRAFGVNDHDWPVDAHPQALGFGAIASVRAGAQRQVALLQFLLEGGPGCFADFRRAAIGPGAQEDVPMVLADEQLLGDERQFVGAVFQCHGVKLGAAE
jgi:hypothetical protein